MNNSSKKIIIKSLIKNKTILTFWCMNRILELNDTKNIAKDYIDHISRSVNLAIKTISNDKTKKSKKKQSGGIPPVLFYGAVLALGSAYSLLSYDQHVTIEKTIREIKKEFVVAGQKSLEDNHPHLAIVYKQISENPFSNECQIYNPNQLTFTLNNKIDFDKHDILKLPGTSKKQKENKKKAEDKALELYKTINIIDKQQDINNINSIIKNNELNNVLDCHVNNVLVAILAETQEIVNDIKKEIGPKSTYDSIMDMFGLFVNPNGVDTHLDGAMKKIDNINLKLNNRAGDAVKLRNNMKIIFNKITSLFKGGYLRINNANTAKHLVQTAAIALVTGGTGTITNAISVAPKALGGIYAFTTMADIGTEKMAKNEVPTQTIEFEQLNGGRRKKKKTRRKYKKSKKKAKRRTRKK
uniref:Uncharacterized protein n=1 Tax=viral metagenome TaxID=1070528 RepID=A0A6C0CQN8_9ZZZZ